MFSDKFYTYLEYKISQAFALEKDVKLRFLWCDGVAKPDNEVNFNFDYIKKFSRIDLKCWVGKSGQEGYNLVLNFGEQSKNKILKNQEIIDCIPNNNEDWIFLDIENKKLEVHLK